MQTQDFRNKLKSAMSRHGLTQVEVGKLYGVDQSALSRFLAGKRVLSGSAVLALMPLVAQENDSFRGKDFEDGQD
nr:MAG TPA: helix-turn-helix domain protein [Caudoviricetes sp.]